MFSYFGSKSKIVKYYPNPIHNKIIEPFAGSARYSLEYWDRDVLLVDKYPVIVDIWHYLQNASAGDINSLPIIDSNFDLSKHTQLLDVERNLIGYLIADGQAKPSKTLTKKWFLQRPNKINHRIKNIVSILHKIKHWEIILDDYQNITNKTATWFIDPPYQFGGEYYPISNKNLNYSDLAIYCKSRLGQAIVCENTKSDWMEFKPLVKHRGANSVTTESIWTNNQNINLFGDIECH
jgi:site-specific DNA-adenine methylase